MDINEAIQLINDNIESEAVRQFLQPHIDRHFTQGLKTWKENHLPALINSAVDEREQGAKSAEAQKIEALQAELDAVNLRHELSRYARSKGVDDAIAELLPTDKEAALRLIDHVSVSVSGARDKVQAELDKLIADAGRPGGSGGAKPLHTPKISDMSPQEVAEAMNDPAFLRGLK